MKSRNFKVSSRSQSYDVSVGSVLVPALVGTLLGISPKQVKVKFGSGMTQAVVFFKELKGW